MLALLVLPFLKCILRIAGKSANQGYEPVDELDGFGAGGEVSANSESLGPSRHAPKRFSRFGRRGSACVVQITRKHCFFNRAHTDMYSRMYLPTVIIFVCTHAAFTCFLLFERACVHI